MSFFTFLSNLSTTTTSPLVPGTFGDVGDPLVPGTFGDVGGPLVPGTFGDVGAIGVAIGAWHQWRRWRRWGRQKATVAKGPNSGPL